MTKRRRLSREERQESEHAAFSKAVSGNTLTNYPAIIEGFVAKGIPIEDIRPRENVFTFKAWHHLGRYVRKGEHGVKVVTLVATERRNKETGEVEAGKLPRMTTVFHVSQTEPFAKKEAQ